MKKLNLLLVVGVLLSGCTTNQEASSQVNSMDSTSSMVSKQNNEDVTPVIDHTSMEYEIEELLVPEEVKGDHYDFVSALQNDHATSEYINFQVLSKEDPRFYTSKAQYRYYFKTQTLEKIKDYGDETIRLWDSIEDEKGNLYEFVNVFENDTSRWEVRYNGTSIYNLHPQSPYYIRQFEKLGEEIYLLSQDIVDETHTKWLVMHFNDDKVEIIDEIVTDRMGANSVDYPLLSVPNLQLDSRDWFSYATEQAGKYTVHSFNQNEKITFEVPESPINIINLKDHILIDVSRTREAVDNPEDASYKQYCFDVKTKELKEVGNEEIGLTYQVSDNEFYSVTNFEKVKLYHFDGEKLTSKVIEETVENSLAHRAVRIDENTDFVKLEDTDDQIHFYLIHWKK